LAAIPRRVFASNLGDVDNVEIRYIFFIFKNFQCHALDNELLDLVPIIVNSLKMTNYKYEAFVTSARHEYSLIIKDENAKVVSRIGFAAQEMKDYQYEVFNEIQNRAIEINNNNAECLLDAGRSLESQAVTAGEVIIKTAREWANEINFLNYEFVTPLLNELDILMSVLQTETFDIFALFNPVKSK
jgi:hypothetical protein